MATGLFGRLLHDLRRLVGTAYLLDERKDVDARHDRRHLQDRLLLIALGNAQRYATLDASTLDTVAPYQRASALMFRFSPMDLDAAQFVRVGRANDGGYVMVDGFSRATVDGAYSFGIGADTSWDEAIAARGIPVLMFDDCISSPPPAREGCRFIPLGVTGHGGQSTRRPLEHFVAEHGPAGSDRLILKMDIEGREWDVLDRAPSAVLDRFSQVLIEFHDLTPAVYDDRRLSRLLPILDKLNVTHQSVHVHANNTMLRPPAWIGPVTVPDALEVTYMRRRDVASRLSANTRVFPTAIDQPSDPGGPDLYLGRFSSG